MVIIMGAQKLVVKQEYLKSEICYTANGRPYLVPLKDASQDQLKVLKGLGEYDHIFEPEKKEK
jgi:hypothetical protein